MKTERLDVEIKGMEMIKPSSATPPDEPGRVAKTKTGNIYVDCNDQDVLFYEADVDANYKDIDFHADVNLSDTLLPLESSGQCSMVDTDAFIHFMNNWSEVARGQCVSILLWFDRSFLPRNNEVMAACNAEFVKKFLVILLGMRSDSGMETIVSMGKEYTSKLEQDSEFLSFACVP
eukprot:Gb_32237 [translate_table: standard]